MRYLMQFRQPAHAVIYDMRHPGIITPQDGVTDYVVESDTPPVRQGPVIITEVHQDE